MLTGTEVKSLRDGKAQLKDGYARVRDGEVWLHNVHIPPYAPARARTTSPSAPRKLLLHRREIERLIGKTQEKGLTLVPTRIYFSGPHAKVEIALARGKDVATSARRSRSASIKREMERALRSALALKRSGVAERARDVRGVHADAEQRRSGRCRRRRRASGGAA